MADEGQTRREMPCLKVPNPAPSLYDHQVNNLHANPVTSQHKQTYTQFPKNVTSLYGKIEMVENIAFLFYTFLINFTPIF